MFTKVGVGQEPALKGKRKEKKSPKKVEVVSQMSLNVHSEDTLREAHNV